MTETVNLFHTDKDFYWKSGTMMSPIYEVDTFKRYDMGLIQIALTEGKNVNIRQATAGEMKWAEKKLKKITKQRKENGLQI